MSQQQQQQPVEQPAAPTPVPLTQEKQFLILIASLQ